MLSNKIKIFVVYLSRKKCFQFGKVVAEGFFSLRYCNNMCVCLCVCGGGGRHKVLYIWKTGFLFFSAKDSSCPLLIVPKQCVCWWMSDSIAVCSHRSSKGFPYDGCEFFCILVVNFQSFSKSYFCLLLYWIPTKNQNKTKQTIKEKNMWMTYLSFKGCWLEWYISTMISRVPNQNGVSLLHITLEIHHSSREPSI